MSIYYSKYGLNTYKGTDYFQAQLPEGYPLDDVLIACRAARRLPPNLRRLSALAKRWAARKHPEFLRQLAPWYDEAGYELDPDTGRRLSDAEIDAQWQAWPALRLIVVDLPVPAGGFPDPDTWEPPPADDQYDRDPPPSKYQLLGDIASRGRKAVARTYGIPEEQLPTDDEGLTGEEAKEVFKLRSLRVIHSDYFTDVPAGLTEQERAAHNARTDREANFLTEAFEGADVYSDLGGEALAIFDRAEEYDNQRS